MTAMNRLGRLGRLNTLGHAPFKGGGFNFADWRAQQLDGIWLDYTDPDWMRQEPNGPTAVAATNDVIGLALSRRLVGQGGTLAAYLAGQPELTLNTRDASGTTANMTTSADSTIAVIDDATSPSPSGKAFRLANAQGGSRFANMLTTGVVSGRFYTLDIWAKGNDARGETIGLSGAATSATVNITTAWQRFVVVIQATANDQAMFIRASAGKTTDFVLNSCKEVSRAAATQSGLAQRPRFDGLNGAIHDALDDSLLSNYTAKSGVNLLLMRIAVPASVPSYQVPAGLQGVSSGRFRLAISNVSGRLECAIGNDTTLFADAVDVRGQTINAAVACDGATVRLFRGDAQVLEVAQNGAVDTTVPFRFGSNNANGGASNFWGGRIFKAGAFHLSAMPDEALWRQISASL